MTQLLTGLPRALDLAQIDLAAIAARLEVVHTEAWLPAKPDHDRPTPSKPPKPGAGPDDVEGEKWDPGLGSHKAREAWRAMAIHLDEATTITAAVFELLCGRPHREPVARESRLDGVTSPADLKVASRDVQRLRGRLRGLQRLHAGMAPNEPSARWLADNLMGPRGRPGGTPLEHIKLARFQVEGVVAIVGTGKRPPICTVCRNPSSIGLRDHGGKCGACAKRQSRLGARQRRAVVRGWQASRR